ncbi:MAG: DUF6265 family protein, partial [Planctomycetota bacterium]
MAQPIIAADDLAFLAGTWRGQIGAMTVEETWLPPRAGNMTGVFRIASDEAVSVVEIMTITEDAESDDVVYRLRHFDTALVPWASEIDGPIEAVVTIGGEGVARFTPIDPDSDLAGFIYEVQDDTMTATVRFKDESRAPFVLT